MMGGLALWNLCDVKRLKKRAAAAAHSNRTAPLHQRALSS
jgi:hypothetical protein